jgi:nitroreductase
MRVMSSQTPSFDAIAERTSVRAYLPDPVDAQTLVQILEQARLAPSGANLQPGGLVQVQGAVRQALTADLIQAWRQGLQETEDYDYFPKPMPMRLRKRQVMSAQALYGALGVAREDQAGRALQFERNFAFFDAPVALMVTIEEGFGAGGFMDLGMTVYGLMLAAQARGLSTCAIGAMAMFPSRIRQHLGLDEQLKVVCGLALGYADVDAPVNRTRTQRSSLAEYFKVVG